MHGILTNVIYTGTVDQKGSLYPGEHERIIDQNTWDRTHETLRRNNGDNGASLLPCGTPMMHTYTMRKFETLPLLRLLQRPAAGMEELRNEVRSGSGDRIRGAR